MEAPADHWIRAEEITRKVKGEPTNEGRMLLFEGSIDPGDVVQVGSFSSSHAGGSCVQDSGAALAGVSTVDICCSMSLPSYARCGHTDTQHTTCCTLAQLLCTPRQLLRRVLRDISDGAGTGCDAQHTRGAHERNKLPTCRL